MKFKKGDKIKVVLGKDKGKEGKIEKVFPKTDRVLVLGVNQYKRHLKARSQKQPSEIVTLTKPLSVHNIMLLCSHCGKTTRAGFKIEESNKLRICRKCEKTL